MTHQLISHISYAVIAFYCLVLFLVSRWPKGKNKYQLFIIVAALVMVMATISMLASIDAAREEPLLDSHCQPTGVIANLYSQINGKSFWADQLIRLDEKIIQLEKLPQTVQENKKEMDELNAELEIENIGLELGNQPHNPADNAFFNSWTTEFTDIFLDAIRTQNKNHSEKMLAAQRLIDTMYTKYPSFRPSLADNLRHAADVAEQQENEVQLKSLTHDDDVKEEENRIRQINSLKVCQNMIATIKERPTP